MRSYHDTRYDADQHGCENPCFAKPGRVCPIRYVIHYAEQLPWADAVRFGGQREYFSPSGHDVVFRKWHCWRVLKPGGKLVLCDFSPRGFQIFDPDTPVEAELIPA